MSQLEELMLQYAAPMKEGDRAVLEAQIWSLVPKADRPTQGIGRWMREKLGAVENGARHRQQLLLAGPEASVLWQRVDYGGMPMSTAIGILRLAVKAGGHLPTALVNTLAEYDSSGYVTKHADGRQYRRKSPSRISAAPPEHVPDSTPHDRTFWRALRGMMSGYLADRLAGCDPTDVDRAARRFEADMNLLISDFQDFLSSIPRRGIETAAVPRKDLVRACQILGMDPPRSGRPVDLKAANKQRKLHARAYHPDAHGGSEDTRGQFMAVMDAYRLLERYNEMVPGPPAGAKKPAVAGGDDNGQR